MIFEEDIIEPSAKIHVFVKNTHTEYFRVAKFAALYNTDAVISFIKCENQFEIPGLAKKHKLKGKALFVQGDYILSKDVAEVLDSIKTNHLAYVDKTKNRDEWPKVIVFNLDISKIYDLIPLDKARTWSEYYLNNFQWISRKFDIVDFEIGSLPKLETFLEKKESKFWWGEYNWFIKKILSIEVSKRFI